LPFLFSSKQERKREKERKLSGTFMPNFRQITSEMTLAHSFFFASKQARKEATKQARKKDIWNIPAKFQPNPFRNDNFNPFIKIDQPTNQHFLWLE
jgi:hypothetical protein